eukprot:13664248-Alexandrium_andersonii.AAC.1
MLEAPLMADEALSVANKAHPPSQLAARCLAGKATAGDARACCKRCRRRRRCKLPQAALALR